MVFIDMLFNEIIQSVLWDLHQAVLHIGLVLLLKSSFMLFRFSGKLTLRIGIRKLMEVKITA